MNARVIAQIIYDANGALCRNNNEDWIPWEKLTEEQQKGYEKAVLMKLANPSMTPKEQHESWLSTRISEGWVYGEVKDVEKKESPCLVPYEELPLNQRVKDHLFASIVLTLSEFIEVE